MTVRLATTGLLKLSKWLTNAGQMPFSFITTTIPSSGKRRNSSIWWKYFAMPVLLSMHTDANHTTSRTCRWTISSRQWRKSIMPCKCRCIVQNTILARRTTTSNCNATKSRFLTCGSRTMWLVSRCGATFTEGHGPRMVIRVSSAMARTVLPWHGSENTWLRMLLMQRRVRLKEAIRKRRRCMWNLHPSA